jgi:hypothetical protein
MSSRRCWLNASTATSYNTLSSGSTIRCPTLPGNHCTTSLVTRHSWSFKSLGRSHRLLQGEQCKRAITPRAITPRAITPGAITPGAITSHRLGPSLYKPRSGSFSTLYRRELVFLNRLKRLPFSRDEFWVQCHFARWESTSCGNLPKHGSPQVLGPPVLRRHVASILGLGKKFGHAVEMLD